MKISRVVAVVLLLVLPLTALAAGKKDAERIEALEQQVSSLEMALDRKITELEARLEIKIEEAIQALADREANAAAMLQEINSMSAQGRQEDAKKKVAEFQKKFKGTDAAKGRDAQRLLSELAVVGKAAPGQLNVEKWYQGESETAALAGDKVSVLVFWEVWCPHCKREVPKLQALHEKFKDRGLQVIGLTKVNRGSTDQKVLDFISANKIGYPMAKETGQPTQYFNVGGVPAAAVVKNGKVIWRGHPVRLSDRLIESWL